MDKKINMTQNNPRRSLLKQFKSKAQGTLVTLSLVYLFLGMKAFGTQFYQ